MGEGISDSRQIGGSGATAPQVLKLPAVTCWGSPGGRKRKPSPLGGEHQPGWSPRRGRCAAIVEPILVPMSASRRWTTRRLGTSPTSGWIGSRVWVRGPRSADSSACRDAGWRALCPARPPGSAGDAGPRTVLPTGEWRHGTRSSSQAVSLYGGGFTLPPLAAGQAARAGPQAARADPGRVPATQREPRCPCQQSCRFGAINPLEFTVVAHAQNNRFGARQYS
jgi:hypothetical protein